MSLFAQYPPTGVPIYSTISAFPTGNQAGQLGVAADTGFLYEWNGSAWIVIAGTGTPTLSLGPFGSTPNADAASLSGGVLTLQPADGSNPGGISTTTQTLAGAKTFSTSISSPSLLLTGSVSGTLTLQTSGTTTSYTLKMPSGQGGASQFLQMDGTGSGQLVWGNGTGSSGVSSVGTIDSQSKSANALVISGTTIYAQTADASFPGMVSTGTQTLAGAKTFSTAPILSSLTASLPLQLDASKNIISQAIDLSGSQATGTLAAGRFPALTGDVTTSAGSLATSLVATSNATLTTLSALTTASSLATVGTIGTGTWQATAIGATYGGTGIDTHASTGYPSISSGTWSVASASSTFVTLFETKATTLGDLLYGGASGTPTRLAGNTTTTKEFLTSTGSGGLATAPTWGTIAAGDLPTIALTGDVTGSASGGSIATTAAATQNNITSIPNLATVGTITSGTWNGTGIDVAHGGTGRATLTNHGVLVGAGTSGITQLSAAAAGTLLAGQGTSSDPAFSATPTLGVAGTTSGTLALASSTASTGLVTLANQGTLTANAYTFAFPLTSGTSGYALTTDGSGNTTWSNLLTNPMTTGGDIIYGGTGGAATRLANGSVDQVLTSAGSTSAPTWSYPGFTYAAKTVSFNAAIGNWYVMSSASFTVTLPDATNAANPGSQGRQIILEHNGTSLTQIYTINTTAGQTIVGEESWASGALKLYTKGERLVLFSDGTNWQIINHLCDTIWQDAGTITVTGSSSNPTKGTTSIDHFWWRRCGSEMQWRIEYKQSGGSPAAGSGIYEFLIPGSQTIDTNQITADTGGAFGTVIGSGKLSNASAGLAGSTVYVLAMAYDSTHICMTFLNAASSADGRGWLQFNSSNGLITFGNTNMSIFITGSVAISGWAP